MSKKYVYMFSEGNAAMKNLLGGKGANLAEMTRLGLPIPQGFTISTEACTDYNEGGKKLTEEMIAQIEVSLSNLEEIAGKKLGDPENPLLVSVRSGARASMPGMMDTVLNLGLNDISVEGLAKKTGNPRFAYDSYRRFIMMFADVVIGVSKSKFERKFDEFKEEAGVRYDTELTAEDLKKVTAMFKQIYLDDQGKEFPQNPKEQLFEAAMAVFRSWDNPRAFVYRRMNDIPYSWGTAVNVQMMVFGNMGDTSGTGVAFTRNAATGEKAMLGEYLVNAQGEDVVAGVRTPNPIAKLADDMPEVYKEFMEIANKLENHYKDMQDMEFTVEEGKLFFLQTRNGKRTANAALRIAVDLVEEGLITKEEALMKVDPKQLDQILHPAFDQKALKAAKPLGKGLPASPGAAAGKVCFTAEDAKAQAEGGDRVILVRLETSPEDIEGMAAAQGILTVRGGMTSHAAVVARGMGTCCVSGCEEIKMNEEAKTFTLGGRTIKEGDYISLDGSTGNIYGEDIPTVDPEISGDFGKFMAWADEKRSLKVRTNADTPHDAQAAIDFGAEGIGLTRTEHMFFEGDRIMKFRKMILSESVEERVAALKGIEPFQKEDFKGIYKAMQERPVTIRLLDPPLHEFMPNTDEEFEVLAKETGKSVEELKVKAKGLHELNPMMGHRGCRLAVSYPEIAEMQTRAIIEAAIEVSIELGINIKPEIMIPLIGEIKELKFVKTIVVETAKAVMAAKGKELEYLVGTMIEIPRAALTADEIATEAEFFSFGTNDLTQMTYGLSRDDAGKILADYIDKNIYECDPTARLDRNGVGMLMKMAVEKALPVRPDIHLGICGEHGGDPSSVEFCHLIGLDYVSCSPFRVPIARLAAAQAQINFPRETRKHE
ncbi:pyruvate, phosphate dikinase [Anaerotignum neopropionicum]|uniref:Pyruvate, phosphate dikinase n=1 Tax=Anaerotignum neopropionicum TaxID=36847 RepID=A0A136WJ78_9FIRM|nr:pyruvate, phosphate dikinase [Anaerotignum neopropionicum]KXL54493.1 pyruvate, phosphate dikinase [Anaerotignum neopropionicum]